MKNYKTDKVPDDEGERWNCLNCNQPMQRWKHADGWKPPKSKGWYVWWFECLNPSCRTRQVMPKGAYVRPGEDKPRAAPPAGPPVTATPLEVLADAIDVAYSDPEVRTAEDTGRFLIETLECAGYAIVPAR